MLTFPEVLPEVPGRMPWTEWLRASLRDALVTSVRDGSLSGGGAKAAAEDVVDTLDLGSPDASPWHEQAFRLLDGFGERHPEAAAAFARVRDSLVGLVFRAAFARIEDVSRDGLATDALDLAVYVTAKAGEQPELARTFLAAVRDAIADGIRSGETPAPPPPEGSFDARLSQVLALTAGASEALLRRGATTQEGSRPACVQLVEEDDRFLRAANAELEPLLRETRWKRDVEHALSVVEETLGREGDRLRRRKGLEITRISPAGSTEPLDFYPASIYAHLRERVVGQDEALRKLAVFMFEHHLAATGRLRAHQRKPPVALLVGPSGCGKTYITRTACEFLGYPFVHVNAANLVQAGIVGTTIDDCLNHLRVKCGDDLEKARRGVVFFDEIDKLFTGEAQGSSHYYASAIQNALLQFIEGEEVLVTRRSSTDKGHEDYVFDTSGLLFLFGGAFAGVERIAAKRLGMTRSIGFGARVGGEPSLASAVTKEDVVEYGFSMQLMGRVSVLANLVPLDVRELRAILENPRISPLSLHGEVFDAFGDELVMDPEVLDDLAQAAADSGMGARRLHELASALLFDLKFVSANKSPERIHVRKEYAESLFGAR